ncbi:MAG: flagellar basal body rod protein FlgB [Phycisphaerales bacterium]
MPNSVDIVGLLEAGIKAEGLRQKTIASNMANIETRGYKRLDINFEELLAKAIRSSDASDVQEIEPEIYQPRNTPVRSNGNDVNLESEIGEMIKNSLRHTTYVRLLQRKFAQMETAVGVQG